VPSPAPTGGGTPYSPQVHLCVRCQCDDCGGPVRREPTAFQEYADEPVLFSTGPHWVSQDLTIMLAGTTFATFAVGYLAGQGFWRLAVLPGVPLLVKIAQDLPRFWRFETILTSRRLVVNIGSLRDVYHTLRLRDISGVELRENLLGRLFGFGELIIELEAVDDEGVTHRGIYALDYLRNPRGLRDAILDAIERL